jgi:hypothetical protein
MPPVPNIPDRPLTQLNKAALVNLARQLALQTQGTVLVLRTRIKDHLSRNPDALNEAQLNRLFPPRRRAHQQNLPERRIVPQPEGREQQPQQQDRLEQERSIENSESGNEEEDDVLDPPSWHGIRRTATQGTLTDTRSQTPEIHHHRNYMLDTPLLEPSTSSSARFFQRPPSMRTRQRTPSISGEYYPFSLSIPPPPLPL